jgi:hypothetical protein
MEAAGEQNISQMVDKQGYLLRQHQDQLGHNWGQLLERFFAVCNISDIPRRRCRQLAEDTLQSVEPAQQPIQQPTQVSDARFSLPDIYDGTPSKCPGFQLQCSLYFTHWREAPTTERSKVATVISLLTGQALEWATAVWESGGARFI